MIGKFAKNRVRRQVVRRQVICAPRPLKRLWKARKRISRFVSKAAKNVAKLSDQEGQHQKEQCTSPKQKVRATPKILETVKELGLKISRCCEKIPD